MQPPKTKWASESETTIEYSVFGKDDKYFPTVLASFNPGGSYIRSHDASMLLHEQTHFDIAELYSRIIQHELKIYQGTPFRDKPEQVYDKYVVKWKQDEQLFDKETKHGTDLEAETTWEKNVADALVKWPIGG